MCAPTQIGPKQTTSAMSDSQRTVGREKIKDQLRKVQEHGVKFTENPPHLRKDWTQKELEKIQKSYKSLEEEIKKCRDVLNLKRRQNS